MAKWSHPELGKFKDDDWYWVQSRKIPVLSEKFPMCRGKLDFNLEVSEDDADGEELPPPSEAIIELALKVTNVLPALIERGLDSLWQDFHGTGASPSGMWWHNAVDEVFDSELGPAKPSDANGLYNLLKPNGIHIDAEIYKWKGSAARFTFESEIDDEHGVSFLTDGDRIIGLGYEMDPMPFEGFRIEGAPQ